MNQVCNNFKSNLLSYLCNCSTAKLYTQFLFVHDNHHCRLWRAPDGFYDPALANEIESAQQPL